MNAIILSIGDELVSGLTINTNAAWLAQQLAEVGILVSAHVTVADQAEPIVAAIHQATAEAQLVLISGGLGPTEDDLTRQCLAAALGEEMVEDAGALAQLAEFFRARQRPMAPSNRIQALRPKSARCLANRCGTAPGLAAVLGQARVYVMPGVPREMKEMFATHVLPELAGGGQVTRVSKLNSFGMGESALGEKIQDLMRREGLNVCGAAVRVGTTVHEGIVSVRIYATGAPGAVAEATAQVQRAARERLGALIFGSDEQTLEEAVGQLLLERAATVATAESCTGGLLAQLLTNVSGSSGYFLRGWVTYANQAKVEELGVPVELLEAHGAVSEPVVQAMAEGARRIAGTTYALAITGVAGPTGGTPEKPVGTVWLGLAGPAGTRTRKINFPGARSAVRLRAAQMAQALLRWEMLGVEGA